MTWCLLPYLNRVSKLVFIITQGPLGSLRNFQASRAVNQWKDNTSPSGTTMFHMDASVLENKVATKQSDFSSIQGAISILIFSHGSAPLNKLAGGLGFSIGTPSPFSLLWVFPNWTNNKESGISATQPSHSKDEFDAQSCLQIMSLDTCGIFNKVIQSSDILRRLLLFLVVWSQDSRHHSTIL